VTGRRVDIEYGLWIAFGVGATSSTLFAVFPFVQVAWRWRDTFARWR
jgi:hypothetical protein